MKRTIILLILLIFIYFPAKPWGFWAHRKINYQAVFSLPPEMIIFYKKHIHFISEQAIRPDQRRYAVKEEGARHYIDIDIYGDSAIYNMPRYWKQAVEKYSEDTLQAFGIVPWHIQRMKYRLTKAFEERNAEKILRFSAEIGHYIADANVPLHTTVNYNGQLTGQKGIHGLWESRLPELFAEKDYDYFVGKAAYLENTQLAAWNAITQAHLAMDSVLTFERQLSVAFPPDRKYAQEMKGRLSVKMYSRQYAKAFHQKLGGQVERQMRASIKLVADFWFTCWVDAGMPDLKDLPHPIYDKKEEKVVATDSVECVR